MYTLTHARRQRGMSTIQAVVAVAAGAIGLVLAIVLLVQYSVTAYGDRDLRAEGLMTPAAVAERLKPVGEITMYDPKAVAPVAAAAAVPVVLASAAAPADKGETTFKGICTGCHSAGIMGSPKFGDKAAWAPRIAKGLDVLYVSAIKGKNQMPAKGGNPTLDDEDIKAAVRYMVSAAK